VRGDLDLCSAQIGRRVVLGAARIGGRLLFKDAVFSGTGKDVLSMVSGSVEGRFGWTPASLPKNSGVDLRYSSVGYLDDKVAAWPHDLDLKLAGFSYQDTENSMSLEDRLRWIRTATESGYTPQPYEQLIGVLRRTGREADARTVARQKQKDARPSLGMLGKTSNWLLGVTLGYGYQLWRALAAAVFMLLLGWIFFAIAHSDGNFHAVKHDGHIPGFSAFTYSLDSLLPVVNLHQEDYRLPDGITSVYLGFHIVAGWALTTLLAFGLTGLARRD
jgi:hypothetical protein